MCQIQIRAREEKRFEPIEIKPWQSIASGRWSPDLKKGHYTCINTIIEEERPACRDAGEEGRRIDGSGEEKMESKIQSRDFRGSGAGSSR